MDCEKELLDIVKQLNPDMLQLAFWLMCNMVHVPGFSDEYDRRTAENGGPLLPDALEALLDEWGVHTCVGADRVVGKEGVCGMD